MVRIISLCALAAFAFGTAVAEHLSTNPFPLLEAKQDVIGVGYVEFATIPNASGGAAPRMMHMTDEPATKRLFVSTMPGMLYSVSYDGKRVTPYLDINAQKWGIGVQSRGSERGLQSFVFHPDFARKGARGYGKLYTYLDTPNTNPKPDFTTPTQNRTHDTVLLEWTAQDASAPTYDGAAPKELFRAAQPFPNHNGGQIGFDPTVKPGTPEYGLLYVGLADGGAGGDPMKVAQNMGNAFGKILRLDPLGTNSANGKYGIPASNPFVGKPNVLHEIYASGVRNPQRFTWDRKDGRMYVADIGQNVVEEISEITAGANLGWSLWEGSYRFVNGQVDLDNPRSASGLTWPIVEYGHKDPLLQGLVAITGIGVERNGEIAALRNRMIFGDNPSGEIFYVDADRLPSGGSSAIRRVLLDDGAKQKTLLELIQEKNATQGREAASRADLRFGFGNDGKIYLMNKHDGVIRLLVPNGKR